MRWLTNEYHLMRDKTANPEEYAAQQEYLTGKIIGAPQATERYTSEELRAMGVVGVYAPE